MEPCCILCSRYRMHTVKPMENTPKNDEPDFWTMRYAAGRTPWDFGGVPAALKSFLERSSIRGRVLIPGCGSGYEVQAFHTEGYDVSAMDFSPAAVEQAKRVLGVLAERIILGDFFAYDFGQRRFDLIYERTFLCSMSPSRWPEYVDRMADLLVRWKVDWRVFIWTKVTVGTSVSSYRYRSRAAFQETLSASAE